MKGCFLMGSRNTPEEIRIVLREAIERLIVEEGVEEFFVGHYGAFDRIAAGELGRLKIQFPHISPVLLLPYYSPEMEIEYPEGFDQTFFPEGMECVPRRYAIVKANQYMVDRVAYLITYWNGTVGNTKNILEYAKRREREGRIKIINVAKKKQ